MEWPTAEGGGTGYSIENRLTEQERPSEPAVKPEATSTQLRPQQLHILARQGLVHAQLGGDVEIGQVVDKL